MALSRTKAASRAPQRDHRLPVTPRVTIGDRVAPLRMALTACSRKGLLSGGCRRGPQGIVGVTASQAHQPEAATGDTGVQHVRASTAPFLGPGENPTNIRAGDFVLVAGAVGFVKVNAETRLVDLPCLVTRVDALDLHHFIMTARAVCASSARRASREPIPHGDTRTPAPAQ